MRDAANILVFDKSQNLYGGNPMIVFMLTFIPLILDQMDNALVTGYYNALTAKTELGKYSAIERSLILFDNKQYSLRRADTIGILYASLLAQDMPRTSKLHVCERLAKMDGLIFSIDGILKFADQFREEVVAKPLQNIRKPGSPFVFIKEVDLVDGLIMSLKSQKPRR